MEGEGEGEVVMRKQMTMVVDKLINLFAGADIREKYDYSKPRACIGLCFIR